MNVITSIDGVKTIAPNSIVNADCLKAMKLIGDKSIDAIICDLPYQMTALSWDKLIPFDLLWEQYKRIIKPNGAIVLFGSQPFSSALIMSNPRWFKYEWIWEKEQGTNFGNANFSPMKVHENILVFGEFPACPTPSMAKNYNPQFLDGKPYISLKKPRNASIYREGKTSNSSILSTPSDIFNKGFRYPRSVIKMSKERGIHPTAKPVPLIEYLIKTYSLEGELILDNTAGSGTLAIAAINTNRKYICIEKDPHYFQVSCDRVVNHDPLAPIRTKKPKPAPLGQLSFFDGGLAS